jgi:hypothetical protein
MRTLKFVLQKVSVIVLISLSMPRMFLAQTPAQVPPQPTSISFSRKYQGGERVAYHMSATNKGRYQTNSYQADLNCVVKRNEDGTFFEECAWSNLVVNGSSVALSAAAQEFRQPLSLDPAVNPSVPDLSKVIPLIGPITDAVTFYSDLWLANKLSQLHSVGDHFYFPHGTPNSWADGNYVLLGQDSIDFDFTLADSTADGVSTIVVRHVPPANPQIKLSTEWMKAPVSDTPNNWVEVEKSGDKFAAEVGKETFDVRLKVAKNGKLLSATMENPVDVLARDCTDAELRQCGDSVRYQIKRQIELVSAP